MPIATVPLPVPLVAPVSVSQESFDAAVHVHVDVVVTSTLDEPAPEPAGMVNGATVYEQLGGAAAAWFTVTVCPAIVRVPERGDVSVFSAIENDTVALPVPLAALVSVSQAAFATAVHPHEEVVVMSTLLEPAAAGADTLVDDSEYEHDTAAAAWLTVNVWPATVSVPARDVGSVLAATENCTVPLPVPDAPAVTDSQETLAVADHVQLVPAVTSTEPVELDAPADCEVADKEYVHGVDDTPDWLTVNVWPAIVAVPVRAADDPFAATVIWTAPSPAPLAPAVIVSHGAWLVAVHSQPPLASTVTETGPPAAPADWLADDSEKVQSGPGAPAAVCNSV
jgi:hypothetical protein